MKRKILSSLIAAAILISSFSAISFAAEADEFDGIDILQKADELLSDLDGNAAITTDPDFADLVNRSTAMKALSTAAQSKAAITDAYYNKVISAYSEDYSAKFDKYMKVAYFSESNTIPALTNAYNGVFGLGGTLDTTNDTLTESLSKFGNAISESGRIYSDYATEIENEISTNTSFNADFLAFKKERLFNSTAIMMKLALSATSNDFVSAFDDFKGSQFDKIELALFFGKELTTELATGSLSTTVKNYVKGSSSAIEEINSLLPDVFVSDSRQSVAAGFKLIGAVVSKAYANTAAEASVKMLFGDGVNKGALQMAFEIFDNSELEFESHYISLLIRKYLQLASASKTFNTKDYSSLLPEAITVYDGMSGSFIVQGLDDYGLNSENITLPSDCCKVVISGADGNVTFDSQTGKFSVVIDENKENTYDAKITVYRGDTKSADTFIEVYPITVRNYNPTSRPSTPGVITNVGVNNGGETVSVELKPDEDGVIEGETTLNKGGKAVYKIIPDPGYAVNAILINGETVDVPREGLEVLLELEKVDENTKIEVSFVKLLDNENKSGYVKGYPDGEFKPYSSISREEATSIFFRILTKEARDRFMTLNNNFTDIEADRWSRDAVSTLANAGIIAGYPGGMFMPSKEITRAEFAAIAFRFYNVVFSGQTQFMDIDGHWAYDAIASIADRNWIQGYEDGTYRPDAPITRAEAVVIINRMLGRVASANDFENEKGIYTDCTTDDWYYADVMEASLNFPL